MNDSQRRDFLVFSLLVLLPVLLLLRLLRLRLRLWVTVTAAAAFYTRLLLAHVPTFPKAYQQPTWPRASRLHCLIACMSAAAAPPDFVCAVQRSVR